TARHYRATPALSTLSLHDALPICRLFENGLHISHRAYVSGHGLHVHSVVRQSGCHFPEARLVDIKGKDMGTLGSQLLTQCRAQSTASTGDHNHLSGQRYGILHIDSPFLLLVAVDNHAHATTLQQVACPTCGRWQDGFLCTTMKKRMADNRSLWCPN